MNSDSRKRIFERFCTEQSPQEVSAVLQNILRDDSDLPLAFRKHFRSLSDTLASNLCQPIPSTSASEMTAGGVLKKGRKKSVLPMLRSWQPDASTGYAVAAVCASSRSAQNRAAFACRTITVGSLVEIQSPDHFADNYHGVCFKVYSPCEYPCVRMCCSESVWMSYA